MNRPDWPCLILLMGLLFSGPSWALMESLDDEEMSAVTGTGINFFFKDFQFSSQTRDAQTNELVSAELFIDGIRRSPRTIEDPSNPLDLSISGESIGIRVSNLYVYGRGSNEGQNPQPFDLGDPQYPFVLDVIDPLSPDDRTLSVPQNRAIVKFAWPGLIYRSDGVSDAEWQALQDTNGCGYAAFVCSSPKLGRSDLGLRLALDVFENVPESDAGLPDDQRLRIESQEEILAEIPDIFFAGGPRQFPYGIDYYDVDIQGFSLSGSELFFWGDDVLGLNAQIKLIAHADQLKITVCDTNLAGCSGAANSPSTAVARGLTEPEIDGLQYQGGDPNNPVNDDFNLVDLGKINNADELLRYIPDYGAPSDVATGQPLTNLERRYELQQVKVALGFGYKHQQLKFDFNADGNIKIELPSPSSDDVLRRVFRDLSFYEDGSDEGDLVEWDEIREATDSASVAKRNAVKQAWYNEYYEESFRGDVIIPSLVVGDPANGGYDFGSSEVRGLRINYLKFETRDLNIPIPR